VLDNGSSILRKKQEQQRVADGPGLAEAAAAPLGRCCCAAATSATAAQGRSDGGIWGYICPPKIWPSKLFMG